jgi:predicted DNA-binding transcriptional regulator AlpA
VSDRKHTSTTTTTTGADPLLTAKPWLLAGISRSAWYRLLAADQAPRPVALPGSRPRWRVVDIQRWVERLRPARRRAAQSAATDSAAD